MSTATTAESKRPLPLEPADEMVEFDLAAHKTLQDAERTERVAKAKKLLDAGKVTELYCLLVTFACDKGNRGSEIYARANDMLIRGITITSEDLEGLLS